MKSLNKILIVITALCLLALTGPSLAGQKEITYFHTDALGSITAASNQDGDVIWRKTYDPYGNEVIDTGDEPEAEEQTYTGKPYDDETGLVYLGQRYYDPELRRFMGIDSVGFTDSNPTSFNRYTYANNNPYRFVDPDGRFPVDTFADFGFLIFDGARVVVNGFGAIVTDDPFFNEELGRASIDFGLSATATATPFLPAVVIRGGKVVDDAVDAAKGATVSDKVREIEGIVRSGGTSFPLDTKKTLDAVADGLADNIRRQLNKGNLDRATDITKKSKAAIDRLDRFDALTPEARNALKKGLDNVLKGF